jgi:S1-C subfamily serine protease
MTPRLLLILFILAAILPQASGQGAAPISGAPAAAAQAVSAAPIARGIAPAAVAPVAATGAIVTAIAAAPMAAAAPDLTGDQLFAKATGTVFRLATRERGAQSEAGHGSAFAIRKNGLLATNFHVVAGAVEHPEKYELVLERAGTAIPAKVVTLDAVNDLALVQATTVFAETLPIAERQGSRAGEAVFSFGFPQSEGLSMAPGNANGDRDMGFGSVLTGTVPVNPGMSGGPCLNAKGEVIGVNRAIRLKAQDISYFSPWKALKALADRAERFHPLAANAWRAFVVDQVERQEKLALGMATKGRSAPQKLGGLEFRVPFDATCSQDSVGNGLDSSAQKVFVCSGVSLSLLGEKSEALNITTYASEDAGLAGRLAAFKSSQIVADSYARLKAKYRAGAPRSPASADEKCGAKNIRNRNGVLLTLRYCSVAVPRFAGLYSTVLKVDHRAPRGLATSFGQLYEGMTMEATLALVEYFVDSVEESPT